MVSGISVIIITHNSQDVLERCLEALEIQTVKPDRTIVVDSGSGDFKYLEDLQNRYTFVLKKAGAIGFGPANNRGVQELPEGTDFCLFLNPDAFLEPGALEQAKKILSDHPEAAAVTGKLKGFDIDERRPTKRIDSTGVFRAWYGRWYDRGQGEDDHNRYERQESVPAICGALMFCRMTALEPEFPEIFDESFFMYKEDIDLSLRLRKNGWSLIYSPLIEAYHCRGWSKKRKRMSRQARLTAAGNELRLNLKHRSPYLVWAISKYILVRYLDV